MVNDTPAGRLLDIFDRMRAQEAKRPFRELWGATLKHSVGTELEATHMCELARLLQHIQLSASGVAKAELGYDESALLSGYKSWARPIFGWDYQLVSSTQYVGKHVVADAARDSLAATHNLLRAVAREGTFAPSRRDQVLGDALTRISALIDEVATDDLLPEQAKLTLATRLHEIRETIQFVEFRGDNAVLARLREADADFIEEAARAGKSPLQARLESWSETISGVTRQAMQAFAAPIGITYFVASGDALGSIMIMAGSSPELLTQVARKVIGGPASDGAPDGPKAIE